jgi:hypothetical protein
MIILAKLKYLQQYFKVIKDGTHVKCVVTGKLILLENLKYWCVERQEPYADASASLKRELELKMNHTKNVI